MHNLSLSSLQARLGIGLAAGAMAFTSMMGTGLAGGFGMSHVSGFDAECGTQHWVDDVDACGQSSNCGGNDWSWDFDFDGFDFNHNDCNSCDDDANDFDVNPFDDFHFSSASVSVNADTTVNNVINAGSANDINVSQDGGLSSADVDADASTTVNNEINAGSSNTVNVD